jgi:cytochrome c-type biogenesis protein CcmH
MLFWILAAVLTAGAVALLVHPLMRARGPAAERADYDLAVYRDQLQELDRDVARGLLDPVQAEAARTEIGRRMLAADAGRGPREPASDRPAGRPAGRWPALAIVVLLPLAALGVYLPVGQPGLPAQPVASRGDAAAPPPAVMEALDRLGRELERDPENLQGWVLMAQVYDRMGRHRDAADAYRRAMALGQGDPGLATAFAEALVRADRGIVPEEARRVFAGVLEQVPDDPRARYYLALASAQAGDAEAALAGWSGLLRASPADAPWVELVRRRIAETAADLGRDVAAVMPDPLPPAADAVPGPTPGQIEAAGVMDGQERAGMIRGMVDRLAARLAEEPGDADGWLRLARAYGVLGDREKALDAYAGAAQAAPDRPDVLVAHAEALIDAAPDGKPPAEALAALRRTLEVDPANATALYVLGQDAADAGRTGDAAELWRRLLARLDPGSPEHARLREAIEALKTDG